jgi:hypothetical protein
MHEATDNKDVPRITVPVIKNALTLQGASRAVVSQVWIYNRSTKVSHHIISQIDLVPDEVPRVDSPPHWNRRLGNESDWTAYCENEVIDSEPALYWYDRLVREGLWAPTWRKKPLTSPTILTGVVSEPCWPTLVIAKDAVAVPLASTRDHATRHHHVLVESPSIGRVLCRGELQWLEQEIANRLHLDLSTIPELWQSAHFFQPLPILRDISSRLDSSDDTGDSAILIDLVPRKGASLAGLEILVLEHRPTGQRLLARFKPESHFFKLPLQEDVEQVSFQVFHSDMGLLLEEGPYSFLRGIRGIRLQIDLISSERRVHLPARKGRPEKLMRIPVSSEKRPTIGGGDPDASATRILSKVKNRLKSRIYSEDKQRWFREDVTAAENAVRKILSTARTRALVVDPYFGAEDVKPWLPTITGRATEVQVLTSGVGLRQRSTLSASQGDRERELYQLEALRTEIQTVSAEGSLNPTTVRVMIGAHPAIHDRFLVADERVWLLGSSLNMFGTRGTMLVELPLPLAVLPNLEEVWHESLSLDEAISRLAAEKERASE